MADTRRTRAYLLGTSFPDNTVGSISAQDMRDYVVSAMGSYANINNNAGDGTPTAQAVATATTVNLDWSAGSSGANGPNDTDGSSYGADADYANDRIRVFTKGIFSISTNISYAQGTASNNEWTWVSATQADGGSIVESNYKIIRLITSATDYASISLQGILDLTGHTNYTDVLMRVRHNKGSSEDLYLNYGMMNVERIG